MSSSKGLFSDIGSEELLLPGVEMSVPNVKAGAPSDVGTSFGVDFAAAWYCKFDLKTSVSFWEEKSEEPTLLSGAFEPDVFFFDSEDLSNNKDCGDTAGIPVGIVFGSSITTFFVSSLLLSNGDTLLDDVCDAVTGSAADFSFDTSRESGASSEVDLDEMLLFDTGFKLWPLFDLVVSVQMI